MSDHVQELLRVFRGHRENAEDSFKTIMVKVEELADRLGVTKTVPRQCKRQTHRSNVGGSTPEEYFRRAVFVPYLDSIISSLEARFSEKNKINFSLFSLHPTEMSKMSRDQFQVHAQNIIDEYSIDNFDAESKTWYDMWSN